MALSGQQLLEVARGAGLVAPDEGAEILRHAQRTRQDPLELASSRLRLPREAFYRALAAQRGLRFLEAQDLTPDPDLVRRVPARLLGRRSVLPLRDEGDAVLVALADPDDATTLESVRRLLDRPLRPAIADPAALAVALRRLGGDEEGGATWDAVAYLHDVMRQAYLRRASDVHLDPQDDGLAVRLRVDGRLREHGARLRPDDANQLLTRVKVLGGLDIAERREPQDGGFSYALGDDAPPLDVRLATIPARHGERATLRLLGVETRDLTLEHLGFQPDDLARLRGVLAQPDGLVLLTGPTGSGKTTTLYAALREVLSPELNVMSVEDPVEFALAGVTQIQVDRAGKVTFARALRSLLRHDPDVLMVGEIRDEETADVALKAAMTGHLVLSSLHTNRAASAVARLVDLGCQRYLVASTLRAVIAQRLVRRLCRGCRRQRPATAAEAASLELEPAIEVYEPTGCAACVGTGFRGRLALSEALWVDDALSAAVLAGASEVDLARQAGGRSLRDDGRAKVLAGETSAREAALARI